MSAVLTGSGDSGRSFSRNPVCYFTQFPIWRNFYSLHLHNARCALDVFQGWGVKVVLSTFKVGLRSNLPLFDRHPKRLNKR